jgi:hypothetical protein
LFSTKHINKTDVMSIAEHPNIPQTPLLDSAFTLQQTRGKTGPMYDVQNFCASTSDSDSSLSNSSEDEDGAPKTSVVLGIGAFGGGKGITPHMVLGGKKGSLCAGGGKKGTPRKEDKKKKLQQASHFRRLRMANPRKRPADEEEEDDKPKKKRRGGASEPEEVRDADARMLAPHPSVIFMREHTPVRPCGRFEFLLKK